MSFNRRIFGVLGLSVAALLITGATTATGLVSNKVSGMEKDSVAQV